MDPLTASAVAGVLNRFLGSAAAEAGRSAWGGLVGLVRSRYPERVEVVRAAEGLTPGAAVMPAADAVAELSADLIALAYGDREFATGLRAWLNEAAQVSVRTGDTHNTMSGTAHNVVQARDTGPIHLG
ncbi:MAG TPA: hypothetical protein VFU73_15095 [Actinocrinis sp.]|nr:hypothetical protein [Actinocrinis sp.]